MLIKTVRKITPKLGKNVFIAENATLTGDIHLGNHCSVWYNAVIRGDVNSIRIGDYANIQDGAVIHATYQKHNTQIGNYVSIGHNAIIHGCHIKDYVLIGMGSIVMDGAIIEENSIVAAGTVVLQNTHVPKGSIYAGIPAKKVKEVSQEQIQTIKNTAHNYVKYASWIEK